MGPIWSRAQVLSRSKATTGLDELLRLIGDDEDSPLMSLVDILSDWIEAYDHEHRPMPVASGVDVLRYMMRQLNVRQTRWLAERFGVSVETFI